MLTLDNVFRSEHAEKAAQGGKRGLGLHNAVCVHHSGQTVCDDQDGVVLHEPVQRLLHHRLAVRIQRARRLAPHTILPKCLAPHAPPNTQQSDTCRRTQTHLVQEQH